MTLVEVLASLAIIGIILAGVSSVRSQAVRQWVAAQRTLAAVDAADALLAQWHAQGAPPEESQGMANGFVWESYALIEHPATSIGLRAMRLELFDPEDRSDNAILQIDTVWSQAQPEEGEATGVGDE